MNFMDGFFEKFARCMRSERENSSNNLVENISYDNQINVVRYFKIKIF